MLERMDDFFTARCQGYDEHMREDVEGDDDTSLFFILKVSFIPLFILIFLFHIFYKYLYNYLD